MDGANLQMLTYFVSGRSPGLVVMGGDSRSKGHVLESRRWMDIWTFFHIDLL